MIINISSRSNNKIVEFSKLKQKKYRDKENLVLLEGERLVCDAIKRGIKFKAVVIADDFMQKFDNIITNLDCDVYCVTNQVYALLQNTENSQGIIGVAELSNKDFALPNTCFLVLDHINDPGNLGTIIRTAVACNYTHIYLLDCVDWRNDKVLRASMGTIFDCNLYNVDEDNVKVLSTKFDLYTTDMQGENVYTFTPKNELFGLVIGNEANGVSDFTQSLSKFNVSIPMQNNVESLNVAVATAIIMYILNNKER